MQQKPLKFEVGEVEIAIANDSTLPPEHYAKRATEKIIYVSDNTHPLLRDQANDLKKQIYFAVLNAVRKATSERKMRDALLAERGGSDAIAEMIRKD